MCQIIDVCKSKRHFEQKSFDRSRDRGDEHIIHQSGALTVQVITVLTE